jgi:uncharacterized membrane protein
MPHCTKCGAAMADNAGFCPNCGAAQAGASGGAAASTSQTGMQENVAGLLTYVLGWVTGLIFLIIDKRPFVQFHAKQSIVVFAGLHLLEIALGMFFGFSIMTGGWTGFSSGLALLHLIQLVGLVLWILLMIKAYQGERFRVPIAADIADKLFGKS